MGQAMDKGKGILSFIQIFGLLSNGTWGIYRKGGKESFELTKTPYLGNDGFYIPGYIPKMSTVEVCYDLANQRLLNLFDADWRRAR